jgi:hypothetical protein
MGYGSNVSLLEEYKRDRANQAAREALYAWSRGWIDDILDGVGGKMKEGQRPTLGQITGGIFAGRQDFTRKVAEVSIREAYAEVIGQKTAACPKCRRELTARGPHRRTVETMVGAIELERPYFYCVRCKEGFYPLDKELDLLGERKQEDVQKASLSLAAEVPYNPAHKVFEELTGVKLSDHAIHDVVNGVARGVTVLDVSPEVKNITDKIAQAAVGHKRRPILVLGIDGADVPTRPESAKGKRRGRRKCRALRAKWQGEWREAKGFRLYLVSGDRIEHLLSWHQVQSDAELAQSLREIKAAGLIPEDLVRLCVIADGAKWIWKRVKEIFPEAKEILDYYHCSEHLNKVAETQFGNDPEYMREWMEAAIARLFCSEVDGVICDLEQMQPESEETGIEISKLANYLKENRERVNYGPVRKGGYPIGSGGIESSNKFISQVRLKRSGAWWYVENANQMLALRCAKYNGTLDKLFRIYKQRLH